VASDVTNPSILQFNKIKMPTLFAVPANLKESLSKRTIYDADFDANLEFHFKVGHNLS